MSGQTKKRKSVEKANTMLGIFGSSQPDPVYA